MVRSTKVILWCVVAALGAGAAIMAFHHSRHGTSTPAAGVAKTSAVPVVTETVSTTDMPVIIRGLGTVAAFNTVSVKSRVVGNVIKINFREGQEVKTGDLLVQLDARPFQAVLDQANASLARDQANLTNAQTDLARYAELLKHFNAPEQQTVEVRPVIVTQTESNVSLISSGLQVGEKVVTAGQSKLSPGATVVISTDGNNVAAAAPAPSNSPAGAAAR